MFVRLARSLISNWVGRILRPSLSLCLLIISLHIPSVTASAQFQFDRWNTDNGLPQNSVLSILQTRDGYLWFATSDGLVRYDGVRFTIFNKANTKGIKSNRFTTLFEASDGTLWIGTEEVGVIRYKEGEFTTFTIANGLPHGWVWAIREARRNPLVLTNKGVVQWKDGRFVPYISEDAVSNREFVWSQRMAGLSFYDANGLHWFNDGHYRTFTLKDGLSNLDFASIWEDQDGTLWVAMLDGQLYRVRNGVLDSFKVHVLSPAAMSAIHQDRMGNIWIGTKNGLVLLSGGVLSTYSEAQGLSSERPNVIYEDREGGIWLGAPNGLYRIRKQIVRVYSAQNGLSGKNAYTVYEDREGSIWVGTWDRTLGGLNRFKDGKFTRYPMQDGPTGGNLATALYQDRDGDLWIGTHGAGLNRFKDGRFTHYSMKDGLIDDTILAIQQDRQGAIWVGTPGGVSRYQNGSFRNYTDHDGLVDRKVQSILEDRAGNLWFGSTGGLTCLRGDEFVSYTERDGLSSNNIRSFHEDADGVLWIGTYDGGLNRFKDGKFTSYTTTQGLFNNGVFQILEDGAGNLWMSCNLGIYRVSKKDLNNFAEGKSERIFSIAYGKKDGLLDLECNGGRQPAGWKARDGKLWFPTQNGVAVIDPSEIGVNPQPPPVVVEDVFLDNKPVPFRETVQVNPGQSNLEIRYTGLSFIKPEQVTFRYRLEGLNEKWVDSGSRRVAYYGYVPPGAYTFRVIAANGDGVWNMQGASIRIVVKPPFWRTWWFISLSVAGLAGLAVLGYTFRISHLKTAHAAQEAFSRRLIESQENERKRIAAELHDGLSQSLVIIKNRAALSLNSREDHERAFEQLEEISEAAVGALDEVKEIAYNLRPFHLDRLGLTKAIEAMLTKLPQANGLRVSGDLDQIDGVFSKESEINFYRIVQESVNNIIKHSQASEAGVKIKKAASELELSISDNGVGFTPVTVAATGVGFGLRGIEERVRMLGGERQIDSAPGQGTTIQIKIGLKDGRHVQ